MKKIDFGFNNDGRLNGSFEGIELYNGEFIDMINCEGIDMLITRIVDSHQGFNGDIDVREIAQDIFPGGSYNSYANQSKSTVCIKIQELLNKKAFKEQICEGKSIIPDLRNAGFKVHESNLLPVTTDSEYIPGIVTSIRPELFEELKQSIRTNSSSMFTMYKEIQRLYAELGKAKSNSESSKQF